MDDIKTAAWFTAAFAFVVAGILLAPITFGVSVPLGIFGLAVSLGRAVQS